MVTVRSYTPTPRHRSHLPSVGVSLKCLPPRGSPPRPAASLVMVAARGSQAHLCRCTSTIEGRPRPPARLFPTVIPSSLPAAAEGGKGKIYGAGRAEVGWVGRGLDCKMLQADGVGLIRTVSGIVGLHVGKESRTWGCRSFVVVWVVGFSITYRLRNVSME